MNEIPQIKGIPQGFPLLPQKLIDEIQKIGKRTPMQKIQGIIKQLCLLSPLKLSELATILQRDEEYLRKFYLSPMIESKDLEHVFSDETHPQKAYKTKNI